MEPPSVDTRQLTVTTRKTWRPQRIIVTYEEVRTDRRLWVTMFFRDWDRIPAFLRAQGLSRMWATFGDLIDRPASWKRMAAEDWDRVPQPIRAMAFMNMIARWEACQRVSERHNLPYPQVVSRLRAVAMAESWFEHRASNENADGSIDLGLAQATTSTRNLLRSRAASGVAGLPLKDEEYFNPLVASRVLVYWFSLMLEETGGDLDLATAAYHVGSGRARRGEGREYLEGVLKLQARFMDGRSASPAWRFLRTRSPDAAATQSTPESGLVCPSEHQSSTWTPTSNTRSGGMWK